MKPYRAYIVFFSLVLLVYVTYTIMKPPPVHWLITFRTMDKNPFGAYILNERASDLFHSYSVSNATIAQYGKKDNLLVLGDRVDLGHVDLARLNELLDEGVSVLIGSNFFGKRMQDSLGFSTNYLPSFLGSSILESGESGLTIGKRTYLFPQEIMYNFFDLTNQDGWEVLAKSGNGPVAIARTQGKGKLILVTNPLVFTNFGLLYNKNHVVAEHFLRQLPAESLHYTMYYQFGKTGATTPLRYFLSEPPLRWAIYLGLFSVMVLLGIDAWRKQRGIPEIHPPTNSSIEYARTLGGLFFREANHHRTAMKLIAHFFSEIRERYWLEPDHTEKFYEQLAGKSGVEKAHVISTFQLIELARKRTTLSESQLVELSKKIDVFK